MSDCKLDFDGDVIRDDGSVNWAAAFAADDGAGDCPKCGKWIAWHPCWHRPATNCDCRVCRQTAGEIHG